MDKLEAIKLIRWLLKLEGKPYNLRFAIRLYEDYLADTTSHRKE